MKKLIIPALVISIALVATMTLTFAQDNMSQSIEDYNSYKQFMVYQEQAEVEEEFNLKGSFATDPETIIGTAPTSTAISSYNTEDVATTTPTTTDYFSLGPNVEKASVNFIVNATSTDTKTFIYSYEVSGNLTSSTTQANFLTPLIPEAGVTKSYTVANTTSRITLPSGNSYYKLTVPFCSNTYDGTDNVPTCHTGLYKFQLGQVDASGIEVYAEIDRE